MLLSIQQKYILEILRKLGYVRRRQLETLIREKFRRPDLEISGARLDAMLRQLRTGTGDVRVDSEFVWISGVQPNALRMEAVDVMLELAEGNPADFTTWVERPAILRFSWGNDLRLFTVAALSAPIRPTVNANVKMSIFAETKCNFSPVSTQVYTALIHHITCRLEARQALIYQLVLGLTGENGKYNYSRAVHLYPPFFDISCSAKNYKIAPALTSGVEFHLRLLTWPQCPDRHHHRRRPALHQRPQPGNRADGASDHVLRHRHPLPGSGSHPRLGDVGGGP